MMCDCERHVLVQGLQNQIAVEIPQHMQDYRTARSAAGLADFIAIDKCVVGEIRDLWKKGIRTYGSCCGHNVAPSMVNTHEDDDQKMIALGYIRWPYVPDGYCKQTFFLKSIPLYNKVDSNGL